MPIPCFFVSTGMILPILVAALIMLASAASINHDALASSQQIIRQSSSQSSSTSTNNITSSITSSVGDNGLAVNLDMSGRIASAQVNTTTGRVEAILFGNWSLESGDGAGTSFSANLTRTPLGNDSAGATEFEMGNLRVHSTRQINEIVVLDGRIDITANGTTIENAAAIIIIRHGMLLVGFEQDTQAAILFKGAPIIGFDEE